MIHTILLLHYSGAGLQLMWQDWEEVKTLYTILKDLLMVSVHVSTILVHYDSKCWMFHC